MPAGLDCGPDDPFMVANRAFARALASAAATFDPWAHPEQCWTAHGSPMRWLRQRFTSDGSPRNGATPLAGYCVGLSHFS